MNKDAAAVVLVDMGLVTITKEQNIRFCSQLWDDIREIFRFRLGNYCFLSSQTWRKKLNSPDKLVSRIQYKFMGIKLATILEKSVELEMILDLPYYDDAFAALVSERNVDKDEKALNKKSPDITDDHKCVNLKIHLGWEQTQINSLCLTILGFQWTIFIIYSSYSNN